MGFLFPKAPKPVPGANPAMTAPTNNPYSDPMRAGGSFIGGGGKGLMTPKNPMTGKTSLIGGG